MRNNSQSWHPGRTRTGHTNTPPASQPARRIHSRWLADGLAELVDRIWGRHFTNVSHCCLPMCEKRRMWHTFACSEKESGKHSSVVEPGPSAISQPACQAASPQSPPIILLGRRSPPTTRATSQGVGSRVIGSSNLGFITVGQGHGPAAQ